MHTTQTLNSIWIYICQFPIFPPCAFDVRCEIEYGCFFLINEKYDWIEFNLAANDCVGLNGFSILTSMISFVFETPNREMFSAMARMKLVYILLVWMVRAMHNASSFILFSALRRICVKPKIFLCGRSMSCAMFACKCCANVWLT